MAEATGRINQYTCLTCTATITTVNREAGVTPMMVPCEVAECRGWMGSAWYRVDQGLTPTHEWYRPGAMECKRLSTPMQHHVANDGLVLRPIPKEATDGNV